MGWRLIKTMPQTEDVPFLVLLPKNSVADFVIVQVTRFEGQIYPDHMDGAIDWDDRVTTATHWMPAEPPPKPPTTKARRGRAA